MDRSATCPSLWTDTRASSVGTPGTMAAWQDLATTGRRRTRVRWSAPPHSADGSRAGALAAAAVAPQARESSAAPHSEVMSAVVVLAQVRSMVVDLLELTGLDQDQALARVPRPG